MRKILQICNGYFGSSLYKNFFEELRKHNIDNTVYVFTANSIIHSNLETDVIEESCYKNYERIFYHIKQKKYSIDFLKDLKLKILI